jgi:hypothetical protein
MNYTDLSSADWTFILESLKYTKIKFEGYEGYPSQEFKLGRIEEATKMNIGDFYSRIVRWKQDLFENRHLLIWAQLDPSIIKAIIFSGRYPLPDTAIE